MIIKPYESTYDIVIYDCIRNGKQYEKLSEGEKSILYDLVHDVRKFIPFEWFEIDIPEFVSNCCKAYMKNKNVTTLQVMANCINTCFPNKYAKIESGPMHEAKRLIIKDVEVKLR